MSSLNGQDKIKSFITNLLSVDAYKVTQNDTSIVHVHNVYVSVVTADVPFYFIDIPFVSWLIVKLLSSLGLFDYMSKAALTNVNSHCPNFFCSSSSSSSSPYYSYSYSSSTSSSSSISHATFIIKRSIYFLTILTFCSKLITIKSKCNNLKKKEK